MTQFIADTFTGADGTGLSTYSASWARGTGGGLAALLGNRARQSGSTTAVYVYTGTAAPSPDYDVSATIYIGSTSGAPSVGVCGRMVSVDDFTFYQARITLGSGIVLARFVGNSATTLATVPYTAVLGAEPKLTLRMRGDQLSVLFDDVVVIGPITDTAITGAGYAGIRFASSSTTSVHLDNFTASTPDTGGATVTDASPGAAALVVTGYAPSIAQTANQAFSPGPAPLIVTGYAPTISQTSAQAISPAPAALVVRGFAPTITQTGALPAPDTSPAPSGGGAGSVRDVRAFAEQLDRASKPTKAQKKQRRQAIEAAVLELLPDEPAAERAAPVIAQIVARELPLATWAPVYGPRPVALPPPVVAEVHARVAEWLAEQQRLAELEDEFEVELLLMG